MAIIVQATHVQDITRGTDQEIAQELDQGIDL
jgi:hypothetical protein